MIKSLKKKQTTWISGENETNAKQRETEKKNNRKRN